MPEVWFLLPGYGAQGASAADTAAAFRDDGLGAVVNSSRGGLFPYKPDEPRWEAPAAEAPGATIADLRQASPMAKLT